MKRIKSILCLVLACIMLLALCACGGGSNTPANNTPANNTPANNTPANNTPANNTPDSPKYTDTYNIVYATTDAANSLIDERILTPY